MTRPPRPSWFYFLVAALSWPVLRVLFRLRSTGRENVPDGGCVLAANHWSNFDPWPLGVPLFPRRYLRFMAKKELFWPPLGWVVHAGGGFRVDRGKRDQQAIDTAVALCREGHAVVMFPEGTRRSKGMRKRYEARWHTGAARIALEAGVPLVPAGIVGTDRLGRLGPHPRRLRSRGRDGGSCSARRRGGGTDRHGAAARVDRGTRAGRRVRAVTPRRERRRAAGVAARDRRRLLRPPRVPRAATIDPTRGRQPGQPAHRPHLDGASALAGGAPARGLRRLGHPHRADVPPRAAHRLPGGARVRSGASRAARSRTRPAERRGNRMRQGTRASKPTTSSPRPSPPSALPVARRSSPPPTATRSSLRRTT